MLSEEEGNYQGNKPLYALDKLDSSQGEKQLYSQNQNSLKYLLNVDTSLYRQSDSRMNGQVKGKLKSQSKKSSDCDSSALPSETRFRNEVLEPVGIEENDSDDSLNQKKKETNSITARQHRSRKSMEQK